MILWKSINGIFSSCGQFRAISSIRKLRSSCAVAALCQRYLHAEIKLREGIQMEIEQDMTISCLRGLQFSWSSSEESCQKQSSLPSLPLLPSTKSRRRSKRNTGTACCCMGHMGQRNLSCFSCQLQLFWLLASISNQTHSSNSLPVPTSLGAHERTGKLSHHTGEKFLCRR